MDGKQTLLNCGQVNVLQIPTRKHADTLQLLPFKRGTTYVTKLIISL